MPKTLLIPRCSHAGDWHILGKILKQDLLSKTARERWHSLYPIHFDATSTVLMTGCSPVLTRRIVSHTGPRVQWRTTFDLPQSVLESASESAGTASGTHSERC